jgi:large subunit ribosomal protein L1
MTRYNKRIRADRKDLDPDQQYPLDQAVEKVKSFKATKFDQSVEICMHLGIDPKHADQAIRGSLSLPHGIGKTKRVVAFCTPDKVDDAKEAGAIEAGGEELVKKIAGGWMEFDVAVASPDMMRVVSKLGKALGPRGLMPSPKSGTVTPKVTEAVKEYAAGKVEYRNDSGGNIHGVIGKLTFDADKLVENAQTFITHIEKLKPAATKGQYVKKVSLSGTMTPGVQVEIG